MRKLENGLSERTLAFEPGFEVHGEVVCRTFQPSYVVTRDGVLIAFCQGRLRGGRDDVIQRAVVDIQMNDPAGP